MTPTTRARYLVRCVLLGLVIGTLVDVAILGVIASFAWAGAAR